MFLQIFSETLWCISESTRCQYSCSKVDCKHYLGIRYYWIFFSDILPQLRSEFIFRARIATLASNMIRLKCGHWKHITTSFLSQSSFKTTRGIQETYLCWAPCEKRRSYQEVESEEDVQVSKKKTFIIFYLLRQGHNCGHLWGEVLQQGHGYFQVIQYYDEKIPQNGYMP